MDISKSEYLKRYMEPKKGKRRKKDDGSVKYISGDLPESLDAFHRDPEMEGSIFPTVEADAPTVVRHQTVASARKSEAEKAKELEKTKKDAELQARYDIWNRGIKTVEETMQQLKQRELESQKPLARYADDADLTEHQKSLIHTDDPMAQYFKKKAEKDKKKGREKSKKKKNRHKHRHGSAGSMKSPSSESNTDDDDEPPRYQGPEPPPNRYGILPGYRWDGVNRSNGFEKQLVDDITQKRLEREISLRWGMEDM